MAKITLLLVEIKNSKNNNLDTVSAKPTIRPRTIKVKSYFLWLILLVFVINMPANGQGEGFYDIRTNTLLQDQSPPSLSIFEDRSRLRVTIETDIVKLFGSIESEEEQDARMALYINDTVKAIKDVKINVRGNTRKKICNIPPVKIDLNETDFLTDWFGKITSVKVVNTCKSTTDYRSYLHKEYLMYELYRLMTDISYRVRLVDLTMKDSKGKRLDIDEYAFFLENDKNISARTELEETEIEETNVSELMKTFYLNPNETTLYNLTLLSIFQYMVGNTDWNVNGLHNAKMFGNSNAQYIIPYDFDYSGFVNAEYAKPAKSIPIKNIRVRYYQGPCCDPQIFEKALAHILSKKDHIYRTIQFYPYLRNNDKEDLKKYLDEFFSEASDRVNFVEKLSGFNCNQ